MSEKIDYDTLVDTLKRGTLQPWQRTDDGTVDPDVGKACCLACSPTVNRLMRQKHLKEYSHTCEVTR